jgi:molecular chaperone GrpE
MKKRHDKNEFDPRSAAAEGGPDSADAFARGASEASDGYDDTLRTTEPPAPEPDATGIDGTGAASDVGSIGGAMQQRLAEQQERYLRLAAEYDNYRKRTARERGEQTARAQADLVKQLIDGLDDLTRFAHVDPATTDAGTIVKGVDMVERKLLKALTSAGLEVIDPINQSFDPTVHEAVATEPALSPEDDHVVSRVYQAGYRFNGQLLRPARVVVKQWNG